MKEKIYNKLVLILVLIQPLFDVITSIMVRNKINLTVGIIEKVILIILCGIYILFVDKEHKKINLLFIVILSLISIFNILINIEVIKQAMFSYLNYMIKYIYLVILFFYFIRWFQNGNKIDLLQLRVPMMIISVIFFVSLLSGTAFYSYDPHRRGISGWFNSANELGALVSLFFPIALYNAFHHENRKKIDIVLFLCCSIMMILIGTKTCLFAYMLILGFYIIYRLIIIRKNKLDWKFLIVMLMIVVPFLFFNELPAIYNTKVRMQTLNIETLDGDGLNQIMLSNRDKFTKDMCGQRTSINIFPKLFGKSYLKGKKIMIVEQDLLDIYYMYGIFGIGLFICLLIYIMIEPFKLLINDLKEKIYDIKFIFIGFDICLLMVISFISGHVLLSPSISTYYVLILCIFNVENNFKAKIQEKKLIIYMSKLSVGGMEKALINLLNMSDLVKKYKTTLYLGYTTDKKLLNVIPEDVNVELICKGEWNFINKLKTSLKMLLTYINLVFNPYKYYCSISYAYQHGILAKLTRLSSRNNIIFIHNDLQLKYSKEDLKKLKRKMQFEKFSKIICVSEATRKSMKKLYPNFNGRLVTINNYIDGKDLIEKSKEKVNDVKKTRKIKTFINICRHEEKAKKVTRIIESSKKLLEEKYRFRVILVGDGENHSEYKKMIKKYKTDSEIILVGKKINPYPYLKMSDCSIVSSEYEGYGLVIDESRVLNVPIISTDVADAKLILNEGYGIVTEKTVDGIYKGMKKYLDNGYEIKEKFDYISFNKKITDQLNNIVEGD